MFGGICGVGIEDVLDVSFAVFEVESFDLGHGSEQADDGFVGFDVGHGLFGVGGMGVNA